MNDIAVIHFKNGGFAVVDAFMNHVVSLHTWYRNVRDGYPYAVIGNKAIGMGRFLLGITGKITADHKNGYFIDNRFSNLREATFQQNQRNQGKRLADTATSKYKGVWWSAYHGRWRAQIRVNGKKIHLGSFSNQESAALAYNSSASKYFGEFARLNQIEQEPAEVSAERKVIL